MKRHKVFDKVPGLIKAYSVFPVGFLWALLCPGDTEMNKIFPMTDVEK